MIGGQGELPSTAALHDRVLFWTFCAIAGIIRPLIFQSGQPATDAFEHQAEIVTGLLARPQAEQQRDEMPFALQITDHEHRILSARYSTAHHSVERRHYPEFRAELLCRTKAECSQIALFSGATPSQSWQPQRIASMPSSSPAGRPQVANRHWLIR